MSSTRPVALVTGAARRLGAGIARRLHGDGHDLALHYRTSDAEMAALRTELEAGRPGSILVLQADLADCEALPRLVEHTLERFGRLDGLVNNASAFFPTPLDEATPAQWDALMAANARAPLFLSQAAAPHLAATGGAIVNLIDVYAERPLRHHVAYGMSKAALLHMTRALALELAPRVRVNAISPGAILWPEPGEDGPSAKAARNDAAKTALLARIPLQRTGTVAEIADAVHWLLREATYVTGQVIRVDGGRLLGD